MIKCYLKNSAPAERDRTSGEIALQGVKQALYIVEFVQAIIQEDMKLDEENTTAVPHINCMAISGYEAYTSFGQLIACETGFSDPFGIRTEVNPIPIQICKGGTSDVLILTVM